MPEFSENGAEQMEGLTREIERVLTGASCFDAFRKACEIRRDFLPARYRILVAGTNTKKRAFLNNLLRGAWGNLDEIHIPAKLPTRVLDKPDGMFIPENGVIPTRDEIFRIVYREEPEASALFPDGHRTNIPFPLLEDFSAAAPNLQEIRIGWPVFWGEVWEMVVLPDWRVQNRVQSVLFPYLESADMVLLLLEPELVKTEDDTAWMMQLLRLPKNCRTIPVLFQPSGEGEAVPDTKAELERMRELFQAYLHKYLFFATGTDAGRPFFQKGRAIFQADALSLREGMEWEAAPDLAIEMLNAAKKPEYAVVLYAAKALERLFKEERARLAESPQVEAEPDDFPAALEEKVVSLINSLTKHVFSFISPWVRNFRRKIALNQQEISARFAEALGDVKPRNYRAFSAKFSPILASIFRGINSQLQEHESAALKELVEEVLDMFHLKIYQPIQEILTPYPPLEDEFQKAWAEFIRDVRYLHIPTSNEKFYWVKSPAPTAQEWQSHSGTDWIMPYITDVVEVSVKAFTLRQDAHLKAALKEAQTNLDKVSAKLTQDFRQSVEKYSKTRPSVSPTATLDGRLQVLEEECRKLYAPEERFV